MKPLLFRRLFISGTFSCAFMFSAPVFSQDLTDLLKDAVDNDPWIQSSNWQQKALTQQGLASTQWMDPKLSVSLGNLATDSFDFNQEAMTQLNVSLMQMLPNKNKLHLSEKVFIEQANLQPLLRDQRIAQISLEIKKLWIEAFHAHASIALIKDNYQWFEQMIDLSKNNYQSGYKFSDSQNILEAELELLKMDDKLLILKNKQNLMLAKLSQYLNKPIDLANSQWPTDHNIIKIDTNQFISEAVNAHPSMQILNQRIVILENEKSLSSTTDDLNWTVGAGYAYRADADNGMKRSDLLSISVSVNVPYFSKNKANLKVESKSSMIQALMFEKQTLANQLTTQYQSILAQWENNAERLKLNQNQSLEKSTEFSDVALNSYTTNSNDFSKVLKAKIIELNTKLTLLELTSDQHNLIAQYQYINTGTSK
ncbi:TolC family protein [Marinicellulosiphila megalodicopiae]|uniref:TolC family protein n=1 Tax=Marinicellulosiphila megalodicopiae TaxID=2724896 RepID=UPI003BAF1C75